MHHVQFKQERRRFANPEPRAQILAPASALLGTTELVRFGSLAHTYMVHHGWECLDRDGDHALMKAPAGWGEGSILS